MATENGQRQCPLMCCLCLQLPVSMTMLSTEYTSMTAEINGEQTAPVDTSSVSPVIPGPFRSLGMVQSSGTRIAI